MKDNILSLKPRFVKKIELKKPVVKPKPHNIVENEEDMVCGIEQDFNHHQQMRKITHRFRSHLRHIKHLDNPINKPAIHREAQNELNTVPTFAIPAATPIARMTPIQKKIQETAQQQQQEVKKAISQKVQATIQPKLMTPVAKPMTPIPTLNPLKAQQVKSKVMYQKNYEINHGLDRMLVSELSIR
jgi:hypothetical protein